MHMQTDPPQANPEYGSPIFKKPPVSVSDFSKKIDATQGGKEKPLVTPSGGNGDGSSSSSDSDSDGDS